jgi:carboxymethylenebutenolidase
MRTTLYFPMIVTALSSLGCSNGGPVPQPDAELVQYRAGAEGFLCHPPAGARVPGIILIHGDRGLTSFERQQAQRLARKGFVVLAVDLYRGKVMHDVEDAHIMDRGLPEEQVLADLKAAADFLDKRPDVLPGQLGVLGWDMGCGYALDATRHDSRIRAVVACEGRLITDPELIRPMQASVFAVFAGKDAGVDATTIAQFRAAMQKAGKRVVDVKVVSNVEHGFLSSEDPAANTAWQEIDVFLESELK